jgi:hypothetical protein
MTDLHVYTYIHIYTKIIHTHTQVSNRKKKHKCCLDEPWRCGQTDESLVKASQSIKMNHGDVDTIKHETSSQVIRCNDERGTLQLCKPFIIKCFHGVDTVANVSLIHVDQRCHCGDATCS